MQSTGWIVWGLGVFFCLASFLNMMRGIGVGHRLTILSSSIMTLILGVALASVPLLEINPWHTLWIVAAGWCTALVVGRVLYLALTGLGIEI